MLTRRLFGGGILAFAGLASLKFPVAAFARPAGTGVSPRMAELADAWEAIGQDYDRTYIEVFEPTCWSRRLYIDPNCPEMRLWRAAVQRLVDASVVLLRHPSQTAADVILKYHVIDMHYSWRPLRDDMWIAVRGGDIYWGVDREAQWFGIVLDRIWLGESLHAAIDGDRDSPKWAEIARWRYGKFAI